jgi:alkylhydroperoxidase family enzyme
MSTTSTSLSTTSTTLPGPCPPAPLSGCVGLERGALRIQEKKPGRERLALGLKRFQADVTRATFGDPVAGTTAYRLCIYDAAQNPVADLVVDRAGADCGSKACWKQHGATGYRYADRAAGADGVTKLRLTAGDAGSGKIRLKARNKEAKQQTALPTGVAAALASSSSVTVQLVADDAACFGATLSKVKRATDTTFRAVER